MSNYSQISEQIRNYSQIMVGPTLQPYLFLGMYGPSWAKYLAGPVGNGRGGTTWPRACTAALKFRDSRVSMEIPGAAAAEGGKSGCLLKAKQPVIN